MEKFVVPVPKEKIWKEDQKEQDQQSTPSVPEVKGRKRSLTFVATSDDTK